MAGADASTYNNSGYISVSRLSGREMEEVLFFTKLLKFLRAGLLVASAAAQQPAQKSQITIQSHKAGLFSAFGHNHTIIAPVSQAGIDPKKLSVEIVVATKQMKVIDKEVSDSDRAEIQSTMLGPKVLDTDKYPEVRFKSSRVEQKSPQHYQVSGTLSLHGVNKDISFEVSETSGHYQGKTRLKQTEFGIQPVTAAGGTIKVKDELDIEFDIYPAEFANGNRH